MYIPPYFKAEGPQILNELLNSYSFGMLINGGGENLEASHLPFLFESSEGEKGTLYTHLARNNPQWKSFRNDKKLLAVFSGPQAYISPLWYLTQPSVPTWNYAAIHFYAYPDLIEDGKSLQKLLDRTVDFYEKKNGTDWKADFTGDFHSKLAEAVVGIRLKVVDIQVKLKLSQNKSLEDRQRVVAALKKKDGSNSLELAQWMEKTL